MVEIEKMINTKRKIRRGAKGHTTPDDVERLVSKNPIWTDIKKSCSQDEKTKKGVTI